MITVDYKPILNLPGKIVLTDCAGSERSYVWMDKDLAPQRRKLVWVQIRNSEYDPEDPLNKEIGTIIPQPVYTPDFPYGIDPDLPDSQRIREHDGNKYYLFQNWFYVEDLLSKEMPANLELDENGDPIPRPDGSFHLGNWDERPGAVKVVLREHKHVLTRQASLDNMNILHRLTYLANQYTETLPEMFLNELNWENLAKFLSNMKIILDYGTAADRITYPDPEYPDDDEKKLPDQYPPVIPHHCLWKQWTLSECLDDLLKNFECRISTYPNIDGDGTPDYDPDLYVSSSFDPDVLPAEQLSYLRWQRRKPIEYREDIDYQNIVWPIEAIEKKLDEDNSVIWFHTLASAYGRSNNLNVHGLYMNSNPPQTLHTGLSNTADDLSRVRRSSYDFICNLFPFSSNYKPDKFTELGIWLKENHVNIDTEYEFVTRHLPQDFYETDQWSRITLSWENGNYEFLVQHHARQCWFPVDNFSAPFNVIFKANVEESGGGYLRVSNLVDMTNNIVIPGTVYLTLTAASAAKVGDTVTCLLSGETFSVIGIDPTHPGDEPELTDILYNGDKVRSVNWSIYNWSPAIGDSDLEFFSAPDYSNIPELRVFDYRYETHQLVGSGYDFETMKFNANYQAAKGLNFQVENYPYQMVLTFVMTGADPEERKQKVIDYLKKYNILSQSDLVNQEPDLEMIAQRWLRYYERVTLIVGLTRTANLLDMYFAEANHLRYLLGQGINPDLQPSDFGPPSDPATNFPHSFPGNPNYFNTVDGYQLQAGNGLPSSMSLLKQFLWTKYYAYFKSFNLTVDGETF